MAARWFGPAFSIFLIAATMVGCGGPGTVDERNGARGAAPTNEEKTAAPGEGRTVAGGARGNVDLDAEVVSPGGAYLPAGFGEGSLWATDLFTCDDTVVVDSSSSASSGDGSAAAGDCAVSPGTALPLNRLDPRSGEKVAEIPLKNFFANITEVVFGAGSVWVSSSDYGPGPTEERQPGDVVFRIDPVTNGVVDRIPVDSPSGLDFGHGSVWVTSAAYGTVSRIDSETGEVAAEIEVGRGAVDVAADEESGAVWVAGLYLSEDYDASSASADPKDNKLTRIDPDTNRVVAEVPIAADSSYGGAQNVAVGEGAVWVAGGDGRLFEVDPVENEVVAITPLGDYFSDLKVSKGSVWATVQISKPLDVRTRLVRVNPRTAKVLASEDLGPVDTGGYGRLVVGGGYVWFVGGKDKTGRGALARISP